MTLLVWLRIPTLLALWYRRLMPRNASATDASPANSIVVFRLDALGDLVLTTPVFRELKRCFPDSQLAVVVQAAYRSGLITNPHIGQLLTVQPCGPGWLPQTARNLFGALRLWWHELRSRRFDVAISPRWDADEHHATLLCALTNAAARVGYSEHTSPGKCRYNRGFHRAFDICLEPGPLRHEVLRNLAVVEAMGGTIARQSPEIHLTPADRQFAANTLAGQPGAVLRIAVGIGAQSPGRRWPLERYAACLREFARDSSILPVITCAPSEHTQAAALAEMLGTPCLISDGADIRETCALLQHCDFYLGNDTGAAHLAAAVGCPTVVVSRHPRSGDPNHPNSPARFAPFCEISRVLQPERGLPGCEQRCTPIEPHCILQITVAEVVTAMREVVAATQQLEEFAP